MEFSRQEYWSGLPFPSLEDLPDPRIEPASLASHWQVDSLPLRHLGSPGWSLELAFLEKCKGIKTTVCFSFFLFYTSLALTEYKLYSLMPIGLNICWLFRINILSNKKLLALRKLGGVCWQIYLCTLFIISDSISVYHLLCLSINHLSVYNTIFWPFNDLLS